MEIIECDVAVLIGECEKHDEYQWQYHENSREYGVWNRPTLSRRDKLNEFQFLICNVLYFNLHFFELLESDVFLRNGDGHVVSQIPDILCIYIELLAPVCVDGANGAELS